MLPGQVWRTKPPTCVGSTVIFHKVLYNQRQVGKIRLPHQFKHWGLQKKPHRTADVMRHNEIWVFSNQVTDPCEAVTTEDPLLSLSDATQGWYSLSDSTNGFCRDEHKSALHMWTPHTDCLQSLGPLTLVRDKVCENAMHGATVCQVIQSPRAVRYEQGLVSSPWKRSAQLHWVGKHQNMHKVIHFVFPTIYRFEFSWWSIGFHVEVLHPSASAFIHSRKIYGLPLQGKILNVGSRWNMSEK